MAILGLESWRGIESNKYVLRLLGIAIAVCGCSFPTPSEDFACSTQDECTPTGRVCDRGFCVVSEADAALPVDQPDAANPEPDAFVDPFIQIAQMCTAAGYIKDNTTGGLYKTHLTAADQLSWTAAQDSCQADVMGATHLIVLSTTDELAFMRGLTGADAWVGLNDIAVEANTNGANFVNVTGEANDQRPFAAGEPNNGNGNEDCVAMRGTDNNLDDKPCNNTFVARYVCECDGKASSQ